MPSTISSISRCSSGSPPAMTTTGDLPAAGASQVAAKQRLEHQDQRIAPHTAQMAAENVRADPDFLLQGNSHGGSL
jgi:hypothetical protein